MNQYPSFIYTKLQPCIFPMLGLRFFFFFFFFFFFVVVVLFFLLLFLKIQELKNPTITDIVH